MRRIAASILALTVAAGCAVGPNYKRPPIAAPDVFYEEAAAAEAASWADAPWWAVFHDPTMLALITEALAKGYDPQIAAWRVEEARAQAGIARSEFFPQIGYQAQFERERPFVLGSKGVGPVNFHAVNVNASWEIDLWGRIRRLNEAARAQFLAAEDNRRGVLISLVS
ncbi:MAG: TolC family protein, partial [Thermoanaerobaculia bacterium]